MQEKGPYRTHALIPRGATVQTLNNISCDNSETVRDRMSVTINH